MTPNKLVTEVNEYNWRLDVVNQEANLVTVNKHLRALHEMLGKIEQKVIERITNNNYKCEPILHLTNTPLTSTTLFSLNQQWRLLEEALLCGPNRQGWRLSQQPQVH